MITDGMFDLVLDPYLVALVSVLLPTVQAVFDDSTGKLTPNQKRLVASALGLSVGLLVAALSGANTPGEMAFGALTILGGGQGVYMLGETVGAFSRIEANVLPNGVGGLAKRPQSMGHIDKGDSPHP